MRRLVLLLIVLLLPTQAWATYAYNEICESTNDAIGTTLTCGPMTLAAGSQIVGGLKWELNVANAISTVTSDQSDTCTLGTATANSGSLGEPTVQMFKCASAVGGTTTFTITQSGAGGAYRRARIAEYTTAGSTYDTAPTGGEATTGTALATGTFSTANAVELVVGFAGGYTSETYSSPLIGGNAGTMRGTCTASDLCLFDLVTSSALASGTAALTQSVSNRWTIAAMSFYESVAAPATNFFRARIQP